MALVRTDVSEELSTSIIRVKRIGEQGELVNRCISSFETWVLTRATRRNIPEDNILQTNKCLTPRNLKIQGGRMG
jgi:hypothetical protein